VKRVPESHEPLLLARITIAEISFPAAQRTEAQKRAVAHFAKWKEIEGKKIDVREL